MAEHTVLYGSHVAVTPGAPDAGTVILRLWENEQEITPEQARAIAADLIAHADALDGRQR